VTKVTKKKIQLIQVVKNNIYFINFSLEENDEFTNNINNNNNYPSFFVKIHEEDIEEGAKTWKQIYCRPFTAFIKIISKNLKENKLYYQFIKKDNIECNFNQQLHWLSIDELCIDEIDISKSYKVIIKKTSFSIDGVDCYNLIKIINSLIL
jgi:hypothetical protein